MWNLIFAVFVNGVPTSPAHLGIYETEQSCVVAARKVGSSLQLSSYRWLCIDSRGNG